MQKQQEILKVNDADVAAKVFDGEAIIMNLTTGMYFSADKVGAAVWELHRDRDEPGAITDGRPSATRSMLTGARQDLERLTKQMLDEGLIVASGGDRLRLPLDSEESTRLPYESPTLNRYDDMAELLALDPPMPGIGDWNRPAKCILTRAAGAGFSHGCGGR